MNIFINNKQDKIPLEIKGFRELIGKLLEECRQKDAEVGLTFVDDEGMRKLNKQYRGLDQSTDVLSFPIQEGEQTPGQENLLGDIVISVETARRQAHDYHPDLDEQKGLIAELGFLVIHGFLHLTGYDHKSDEEADEMEKRERELWELFCLYPVRFFGQFHCRAAGQKL